MADKSETELLRCEDCAPEFPCWEFVHSRCRKRAHELGAGPEYLKEAFRYLCRELERKQGMIDDLHKIANDSFGLSPEDCALLTQAVRDRDNLKVATEAIACVFY
jgi:hypothetical protein